MRVTIWVYTLFIYGALLSGCGALPHQQNGMTERAQIDADVQTNTATIAATAQANSDALAAQVEAQRIAAAATTAALDIVTNATAVADTNQTNAQIAQTQARASVQNNQAWSSAVVVMVLLISAGTVVAIVAYWIGRRRVAVVDATAAIMIAQNKLLFDRGPTGNETQMSIQKFIRDHDPNKQSIVVYSDTGEAYGALNGQMVRLYQNGDGPNY